MGNDEWRAMVKLLIWLVCALATAGCTTTPKWSVDIENRSRFTACVVVAPPCPNAQSKKPSHVYTLTLSRDESCEINRMGDPEAGPVLRNTSMLIGVAGAGLPAEFFLLDWRALEWGLPIHVFIDDDGRRWRATAVIGTVKTKPLPQNDADLNIGALARWWNKGEPATPPS